MRRKVKNEGGRTTLYIVNRKLWQEAKEAASERRSASVSEVVFDALESSIHDTRDIEFLRAMEKRAELATFTIGAVADSCRMTRGEVLDKMGRLGFSVGEPDFSWMRQEVHKRLQLAGIAPREDRILPMVMGDGQHRLEGLNSCFERNVEEFANEYQFTLDSIWQEVGGNKKLRSWLEIIVDSSAHGDAESFLSRIGLGGQGVTLPGPKDWHYSLAYLASVGLAVDQARILRQHFENQDSAQVAILSWIANIRRQTQEDWGAVAATQAFRNLWGFVSRESLDLVLPGPTTPLSVTIPENREPKMPQIEVSRELVIFDQQYFPEEVTASPLPKSFQTQLLGTIRAIIDENIHGESMRARGVHVRRHVDETMTEDIEPGSAVPSAFTYTREFKMEVKTDAGPT